MPCSPAAPHDDQLAEDLASWLEDLGLAEQLEAAGLPSYVRGADGAAHWREPATGEPLTHERLVELDRLLRAQGDDPAHAVPVGLVRLRRETRLRAALLDGGWLDYAGVARLRGTSDNAARFALHKAAERRTVLLVQHEGATLVPSFQLDDAGEVRERAARSARAAARLRHGPVARLDLAHQPGRAARWRGAARGRPRPRGAAGRAARRGRAGRARPLARSADPDATRT